MPAHYKFRVGISIDVEVADTENERDVTRRFIDALLPIINEKFRYSDGVTAFIERPETPGSVWTMPVTSTSEQPRFREARRDTEPTP